MRRHHVGGFRVLSDGFHHRDWHFSDSALPEVARQRRVSRERHATVTTLARLQRRVARDLMLATLAVTAELRATDAAHVAETLVFHADVST